MQDNTRFDVVVIGGGPGGYVAAIKAAQLGLSVACVESRGALGGTCLNVGCIPSKALLESSHLYHQTHVELAAHGITVSGLALKLEDTHKRRINVVSALTKGIEGLFKKNKVTYFRGIGSLLASDRVKIVLTEGTTIEVSAKNIVIATGSEPISLPSAPFDGKHVISSTEALELSEVPEHLVVIGGGVIGLELGSVWLRFGAKVTVIEAAPSILPGIDRDIQIMAKRLFEKQGFVFHTESKFSGVRVNGEKQLTVQFEVAGSAKEITASKVLVCVGRRAYTRGLGLDALGIKCDERGRILTDTHFQTNVNGIFAIGDVTPGPMLAHKAEEEGVAVAEFIAKGLGHVNYRAIPGIVYTSPEIAVLGLSEDECKKQGMNIKVGKFPFMANGRAKTAGQTDGFVKVIADGETDKLLGFHIIGADASELIAEAVMVFEYEGSAEDMARSVHAHPTLSEALKEAAMDVSKTAIHM